MHGDGGMDGAVGILCGMMGVWGMREGFGGVRP